MDGRKDRTFLEFKNGWQSIKLDDQPFYRKAALYLPGFKSVDYISISPDEYLYFFELKDFRSPSSTKISEKLPLIAASKFKDSLATIVIGNKDDETRRIFKPYIKKLIEPDSRITLFLIIESDLARNKNKWKSRLDVYTKLMKKYLRWAPVKIKVTSQFLKNLPSGVIEKTMPGSR